MVAITLLFIHLFNLAGYQLLFEYFIIQSDKHLTQQLDSRQYDEEQLVEVKLPLHLPYLTNWNEYERVDGEMEVKGVYYSYVKRKVCNDTLYLLCLPNQNKTQFSRSKHNYAIQVNGMSAGAPGSKAPVKKILLAAEYQAPVSQYRVEPLAAAAIVPAGFHTGAIPDPFVRVPYQPPRSLA